MTKDEVVSAVTQLAADRQLRGLTDLGMFLTIAARGSYPVGDRPESFGHLVGFNEMQHSVYG